MVSGLAIEAAWATAHMVMYPLGLLSAPTRATTGHRRHTLSGLSPEQRGLFHYDVEAAATPILLVHGIHRQPRDLHRHGTRTPPPRLPNALRL